ncbi:MAG: TIGR01459 family HAD-type hydrolase [Litoreibacter sp.]|nr:TIGR01459 family HAD-type hydrolase [Litoreibacter sp.]
MTQAITSVLELAGEYDAIVFDQWGVLHDGTAPYSGALDVIRSLKAKGQCTAILSNSGKRAESNLNRIARFGFDTKNFSKVITSGEALWQDVQSGKVPERAFFAIERSAGDAAAWAAGLEVDLVGLEKAKAVLLMGLPDRADLVNLKSTLKGTLARHLPLYCSNPDKASPRADGLVVSPGALAEWYRKEGGQVRFYGKPHGPVFDALQTALACDHILMVGDSLEHDIAGAARAGWDSVLIQNGLYRDRFAHNSADYVISELVQVHGTAPTYSLAELS